MSHVSITHVPSSFLSFLAEEGKANVKKTEQPRERKRQSLRKKKRLEIWDVARTVITWMN